jgi:hypothetical protein
LIVSPVVRVTPASVAEMIADVLAVATEVETGNAPTVSPAATVTVAGTDAAALLLARGDRRAARRRGRRDADGRDDRGAADRARR